MAGSAPAGVSFSVVVSNYNYGRFLSDCLDSALAQMEEHDELIVVDDGSTDNSMDILHRYHSEHGVQVLARKNAGQLDAVRAGVLASRGEVILLLDADDYYLPGYLQRVRALFAEHQALGFVTTIPEIDSSVSEQAERMANIVSWMQFADGLIGPTRWSTQLFFEFAGHPTSGLALRKDVAKKIVTLPMFELQHRHISDLFRRLFGMPGKMDGRLQVSADGLIVRCTSMMEIDRYHNSHPGFYYRIHSSNMYATMNRLGSWYTRVHRKKAIIKLCEQSLGLSLAPTARELEYEISNRAWANRKRRRLRYRMRYCFQALISRGAMAERFSAARAAIFTPYR